MRNEREPEGRPFLQIGDVIELKGGDTVYEKIPMKYVADNKLKKKYRDQLFPHNVKIGENYKGYDTNYLKGKYVVTNVAMDGGSRDHNNSANDYPDGHHVWCQRLLPDNELGNEVDFYQSGSFNATISTQDIQPIGKVNVTRVITTATTQGVTRTSTTLKIS